MTDRVSKETRSAIMTSVKNKNTGAEMIVRKIIHGMGYRYRLHRKDLPGSPIYFFQANLKRFSCMDAFGMATIVD